MQTLNLPSYEFRIKKEEGKSYIFDGVRKRYVLLTPEEWVRQHFIRYLVHEKKYPESLMAVEKQIILNGKQFRFDLLVYRRNGEPLLIAEFKAPGVKISQDTFDQVVRYNMALKVERVVVSNGMQHFVCEIDYEVNSYKFLKEVPAF
ncbi:restriction endonuclease subunit R [Mariniphaga sediminis]|uniref:Restriction endonuclease subunit R n=1 Tax=Mariniphaga sediminis TaxID=1628158 RepID=A0A399D0G8_9BACT|nr:type I restriction enzyme HsdR N-terminal domain-containing protein [Mariniphaga sediminis]RIH65169.1 restriction endonuclease subunit R [Mariniphaga sediminis]